MPNRTFYTSPASVPADIDRLQPELVSVYCCFSKGYTPPPFQISQDEDTLKVKVKFELSPFTETCHCNIECTTGALVYEEDTSVDPSGEFCPADEELEVTLSGVLFKDYEPTDLIFNFTDASGNTTQLIVKSIATVIPIAPLALVVEQTIRDYVQVGVLRLSYTSVNLSEAIHQYQVQRYVGDPANSKLWIDWTTIPTGTHFQRHGKDLLEWDRDVRPGVEYGYRVRFRSTFDQASQWSAWRSVTV